ncbi:unnamed protein product [Macrosiphum euphorbiae]|uniref:Uncharacterized protein n=1 Tax=Macrosiphum euphorbiae TaxID=13131 RepID=A0AAV0W1V1_9HEMI|nr:unnamed protein product [Macrosiphum euphorbiae]
MCDERNKKTFRSLSHVENREKQTTHLHDRRFIQNGFIALLTILIAKHPPPCMFNVNETERDDSAKRPDFDVLE